MEEWSARCLAGISFMRFVDDNFAGSLPAFIAAFTSRNKLTEKEIAEIKKLIDSSGQED